MIAATQMRPGMVIKFNNDLFSVFKVEHRTPGNLRGFVQAKMRNLRSGTMIEHRYDDGEFYYFMNSETFDQMHFTKEILGDAVQYLIPQLKVTVEFYEGK